MILLLCAPTISFGAGPTVIGDASIREQQEKNSLSAEFVISGRRVDSGFSRETVPGEPFLTISEKFPNFVAVTTYYYLGEDGKTLRFQVEKELERQVASTKTTEKKLSAVVSFTSEDGVKYVVVPEVFQFTGYRFELITDPKRGAVSAFFVTPSGARQ
jgi:hypothetical protein